MKYQEQIHTYIQEHKSEIIYTLKELVKIPSVRGEETLCAPFGEDCAEILRYTQSLYAQNGFETQLDQNGGYLLSYYGEGKKTLGVFAHADVVAVNDDWIYTKPFEPLEKDNCLIGRGTLDDKSAVVISLYCAKILKELKIPFNSRLVMFTGANEEEGMQDIINYVSSNIPPEFSLVSDTAFPLFRGNKGILRFWANSSVALNEISDFGGGTSFNIILGEVTAKYKNSIFTEKGISKHGALPEGSVNAGYLMAKKLSEIPELDESDRKQMQFVVRVLEKYYGEVFNIENTDADFGKLTVTNGMIDMQNNRLRLSFDMRFGAAVDIENTKKKITEFFHGNNWSVEFVTESAPFLVPEDNPWVKTVLNTYKEFTGNKNASSYINAGGTYARYLPCAVEIGTALFNNRSFDLPEGHGSVHQPDEYINTDGFLKALELTALMIIELDEQYK